MRAPYASIDEPLLNAIRAARPNELTVVPCRAPVHPVPAENAAFPAPICSLLRKPLLRARTFGPKEWESGGSQSDP